MGTIFGQEVYNWDGPFCGMKPSSWILIPDYGIRRVQFEEMARLKGLDYSNYYPVSYPVLVDSIEQHVWATIGKVIAPLILPSPLVNSLPPLTLPPLHKSRMDSKSSDWKWSVPDLSVGSKFYADRVSTLFKVIKELNLDHDHTLAEGLGILAAHRQNYGKEGPAHLTVIWREWPSLHWDALRLGSSMNFMAASPPGKIPNSPLQGPALSAAI